MRKVFVVLTERDGDTTKSPGRTETEIVRADRRYAAESIDDVWDAAHRIGGFPDETIVAIYQEHPAIVVLGMGSEE